MSIRIRVYPQYGAMGGMGGYGGLGGYGSYGVQNQLLAQQLKQQQQTSNLRLSYERQLWAQRLQMTQLQAQIQYGGLGAGVVNPYGGYGVNGLALGGLGAGMVGGIPPGFGQVGGYGGMGGFGGSGQTNATRQIGGPGSNQSVANSNSYSSIYAPGFGSAGWMGSMLGGIFG